MLRRAFVLSIVLHFAIFLGAESIVLPSSAKRSSVQAPLIASLGKPAIVASDTRQAKSNQVSSQPSLQSKRTSSSSRVSPMAPAASPNAASALPVEQRAAGELEHLAVPAKEGVTPTPPPVELTDSVSLEGFQQYRLNLAREARRFRQYPAYARERGWEGEVVVVLSAQPGSDVPVLRLGKGSGHESLDQQALEMIKSAARRAVMPDTLSGKRFSISVPVQFRLDD